MLEGIDRSTLVNLKVLAKVRRGQKLNTKFHHYSISDQANVINSSPITRWWHGESRQSTMNSLENLFRSATFRAEERVRREEMPFLVNQLIESSRGLRNLYCTYENDETTCSEITYILEQLKHFILAYGDSDQLARFNDYSSRVEVAGEAFLMIE